MVEPNAPGGKWEMEREIFHLRKVLCYNKIVIILWMLSLTYLM